MRAEESPSRNEPRAHIHLAPRQDLDDWESYQWYFPELEVHKNAVAAGAGDVQNSNLHSWPFLAFTPVVVMLTN